MSFSIARVLRVCIAATDGTIGGLWLLRDRANDTPPPPQVAVSEVAYNPAMASLRLRVTINGKRGFVNGCGQTIIEPTFALAMPFSEGLAAVANRTSAGGGANWRFVDAQGNVVFARSFVGGQIGTFHEGLAPIRVNGRFGYIDTAGRFAIAPAYDGADDFSHGLAAVRTGRKYGLIDRHGQTVLPPTYDFIGSFKNGLAIFASHDRFGYLNARGEVAIPPAFDRASDFSEGLAFVGHRDGDRATGGYVDTTGRLAIPFQTIRGGPFHEGLAAVQSDRGPYYINPAGAVALKPEGLDEVGAFSEHLAPAKVHGLFGFIDRNGAMVIRPQWQLVTGFVGGACRVNSTDVRGYINRQGQYIWKLAL
jgi:hypothetical protein